MASKAGYRAFHGKEPTREDAVAFKVPKEFTLLGRAVAIEYECDKLNGGGDGTKAVYRHKFGKGDILVMDESRQQLFVFGPRLRVTERGIEG